MGEKDCTAWLCGECGTLMDTGNFVSKADLLKIIEWMESKAGEAYDKQDYKGYTAYLNCEQKARKLLEVDK